MKILIIRFSSIGDIVLTTPVIRCLKQQLKHAEIHYLTKKAFKPILESNPYIDKLHLLENSLGSTIEKLKTENFDHIIDLHHNLRTRIIKFRMSVHSVSFDKLNLEKWMMVNLHLNKLPQIHIVDRYLKTVEFLGVKNDGKGLDYFLAEEYDLKNMLPSSHQNFTGLVIGAQHATKRLPQQKLIELCKLITTPIVLLGGPEDSMRAEEICRFAGSHVYNACGKFSIDQSAFLVKQSQKIITHDTGLMHIAAAFNKSIISVWGNTIPEFGMYPYNADDSSFFEVKGLPCRPCSKIGYDKCPRGHFKCMNNIDLNSIGLKIRN
ncbi:glycosyltransferase family 9 protein [Daejeonella oryzae]|uniref:glycosyltransferase family 9 protein n=1 Tax=Daejeonella oryzae TaxID=1122943 RepID=UPI0004127CCE|nr:glycosyltransferase family 9 protein [Daejeonella oryzae]